MPARRFAFETTNRVPTIWDERYTSAAAPTISTTKQAEVVHAAMAEGLIDLRPWPFNETRAWESIASVHAADYVRAVRTGHPRALAESQGFTWSPEFARSVARIWAGHAVACRTALDARIVLHPVSGAHHAHRSRGSGFCTFNFLVGAGMHVLESRGVRRIVIVDLDAHQGDGTWRLVKDDERFGLFDVAGSDWAGARETERTVLRVARDAEDYLGALALLDGFLDRFAPDLVEYQAGVDCHEDDFVGGIRGVDARFLAERDLMVIGSVIRRGIPLVVNLAGGYQPGGATVMLHLQTVRIAARQLPRW
ncbi:MAG: hypothetical protein ACE148_01060 [Vicinamibacterales bacterium]